MTQEQLYKAFPITSICRADIDGLTDKNGDKKYDISKLDDGDMERIASKMADAYCDNGFWIDLDIIAEHIIKN